MLKHHFNEVFLWKFLAESRPFVSFILFSMYWMSDWIFTKLCSSIRYIYVLYIFVIDVVMRNNNWNENALTLLHHLNASSMPFSNTLFFLHLQLTKVDSPIVLMSFSYNTSALFLYCYFGKSATKYPTVSMNRIGSIYHINYKNMLL